MLLTTRDGISCDICGTTYKKDFIYYSFESTLVTVNSTNMLIKQLNKDLDLDVCEKCYLNAETKVRANIKTAQPNTVKCDFCTTMLKGSFNYHRILVHKVVVSESQKDAKGVVIPSVFKNFMDFNSDDACFQNLVNLAMETRNNIKTKGEWS